MGGSYRETRHLSHPLTLRARRIFLRPSAGHPPPPPATSSNSGRDGTPYPALTSLRGSFITFTHGCPLIFLVRSQSQSPEPLHNLLPARQISVARLFDPSLSHSSTTLPSTPFGRKEKAVVFTKTSPASLTRLPYSSPPAPPTEIPQTDNAYLRDQTVARPSLRSSIVFTSPFMISCDERLTVEGNEERREAARGKGFLDYLQGSYRRGQRCTSASSASIEGFGLSIANRE
ncbi:hypothetical protein E2C01_017598 [Portunus trituberculatus]|uniref:Uncharacterized protein n=1 Tax=Portunus trituberculatus TaxID=210409 RepID=A0A5B7DTB1_PORTR|nr:hypothetical protein [Portunus trituberculatus]